MKWDFSQTAIFAALLSACTGAPAERQNGALEARIPVYFHQILPADAYDYDPEEIVSGDDLPDYPPSVPADDTVLADQLTALNQAYQDLGFHFQVAAYDFAKVQPWYEAGTEPPLDAYWWFRCGKSLGRPVETTPSTEELATCSPATNELHVYINGTWGAEGAAFRPEWVFAPQSDGENRRLRDGVVVDQALLPWDFGQSPPDDRSAIYVVGYSLVHEVGHWLGLRHVFSSDGSCTDSDEIADTPPARAPATDCENTALDSCTGDALPDDVNNFMNYASERCAKHFTTEQVVAMQNSWKTYRGEE